MSSIFNRVSNGVIHAALGCVFNSLMGDTHENLNELPSKIVMIAPLAIAAGATIFYIVRESINSKSICIKEILFDDSRILNMFLGTVFGGLIGYCKTNNCLNIIRDSTTSLIIGACRFLEYSEKSVTGSSDDKSELDKKIKKDMEESVQKLSKLKAEYDLKCRDVVGIENVTKEIDKEIFSLEPKVSSWENRIDVIKRLLQCYQFNIEFIESERIRGSAMRLAFQLPQIPRDVR